MAEAAALLPEKEKEDRAHYLNDAGYDLYRIDRYSEALPLYEQSLSIRREISDKDGEGATLNKISKIYDARGDDHTTLSDPEQKLKPVALPTLPASRIIHMYQN